MSTRDWSLGATRDPQSVTPEWDPHERRLIAGVVVQQIKNVVASNGVVTELFRLDWGTDTAGVGQVFQRTLVPGGLSAWHAHQVTTDRLIVLRGLVRLVLYDARPGSATHGSLNVFDLAWCRPTLIVVPPRVWHGVRNSGHDEVAIINIVDRAYSYSDPDHWRLDPDTDRIPYRFDRDGAPG